MQNATDEIEDKHIDSEKSNGHIKLTDTPTELATHNDDVRTGNAKWCRDSSAGGKLKVIFF